LCAFQAVNEGIMCSLLNAVEEGDNAVLEELLKQGLYNVDATDQVTLTVHSQAFVR